MSSLAIKTRDNSNPKDKQKLYVCCHPDDFEPLFHHVSKEIWDICDVAMCYDSQSDSKENEDMFFSDISQMRLAVVIVTRRFLTEPSYDRDVVLPFFSSRNIPILPIVREGGLTSLFSNVLGDLQYLDVNDGDDSALPYEVKLSRFLAAVLPDDDTIARIRAAFSAYVFLSYRKVDRKDARDLMRLIHENEACRDVAIWYDEFLTPGEDFNNEIAEAILKSKLFAMAVTPNILKNDNYIIRKEYPFAHEQNKNILPVELKPTDRDSLCRSFEAIPECVLCDDRDALTKALNGAMGPYAKDKCDPMRDFLIGLAHLNGVDVEMDPKRAFARIGLAASRGLVEAQEKLVDMHWNGDGTPVNHTAALRIQDALINTYEKKHEESKNEGDSLTYARALYRMAELLCEELKYEQALPYAKKARSVVDDLSLKNKKYDYLVSDYDLLCAKIHFIVRREAKGYLYLLEALVYMDFNANEIDLKRRLLTTFLTICKTSDKEWSKNDKQFDCVSMAEEVYAASGREFDKCQLMQCLYEAQAKQDDKEKRRQLVERSFELIGSADPAALSPKMQICVAYAYFSKVSICDDDQEKLKCIDKAIQIAEEHPHSFKSKEIIALAHLTKYILFYSNESKDEAKLMLDKTIDLVRPIAEKTENANHYESLIYLEIMKRTDLHGDMVKTLTYMADRWKELCGKYKGRESFRKKYAITKRAIHRVKIMKLLGLDKKLGKDK